LIGANENGHIQPQETRAQIQPGEAQQFGGAPQADPIFQVIGDDLIDPLLRVLELRQRGVRKPGFRIDRYFVGMVSHDCTQYSIILDVQDGRFGLSVIFDDGRLSALDRLKHLARVAREVGFGDDLLVFHDGPHNQF